MAQQLLEHMISGQSFCCKSFHTYGTCSQRTLQKFIIIFKALLRINLPIHIIPAVLFKLKQMIAHPVAQGAKLTLNIVKSCMFLTSFVWVILFLHCYLPKVVPKASLCKLKILINPKFRLIVTCGCLDLRFGHRIRTAPQEEADHVLLPPKEH